MQLRVHPSDLHLAFSVLADDHGQYCGDISAGAFKTRTSTIFQLSVITVTEPYIFEIPLPLSIECS